MVKRKKSSQHEEKDNSPDIKMKKLKGESFYRNTNQVRRKQLLGNQSKATRNAVGKIIKPGILQNPTSSGVSKDGLARIQPDRRWFGNTRVVGVHDLEQFREDMATKLNNPYQLLLRRHKLPLGLIQEQIHLAEALLSPALPGSELLKLQSFETTFGPKAQRKKPKIMLHTMEDLAKTVEVSATKYNKTEDGDLKRSIASMQPLDYTDSSRDAVFSKGQSKRIWNELYKVVDSSDVLLQLLDARDPLGTRCYKIEEYLKKEKAHKHLVLVLNKCDLVPAWVTVSVII
jgi:nuclear GTP-binding protein